MGIFTSLFSFFSPFNRVSRLLDREVLSSRLESKIQTLIQQFPEILNHTNQHGQNILGIAIWKGHFNICRYCETYKPDVNLLCCGAPLLYWAVKIGHYRICEWLLDQGVDVNQYGLGTIPTPIHVAVSLGHVAITELLIERGADVNSIWKGLGVTPLHLVAHRPMGELERVAIFQLLVDHGADMSIQDANGDTAFNWALEYGHLHDWLSQTSNCQVRHHPWSIEVTLKQIA